VSARPPLDLNRAALLPIDIQREYFAETGPLRIPDGAMVLAKLRSLLGDYREANMPIVHVRHEEAAGAPVFAIDGPLVETMPDVAPRHIEPVVIKHAPGAFTDTELSLVLNQLAVRKVVIAGFMTHMCCDTTARQAQERGLDVIFLTDGTATRSLAFAGRTIDYRDVQAATLAAQADGFSTLADVSTVRASLADAQGY
jgi:nicotinamidase-related amidase